MTPHNVLVQLALGFAMLSLLAIGGANSVIPEMHRLVVDVNGWMSSETFAILFALAQAAPGPNVMIVTLVGWKAAGPLGAVVATVAILAPAATLTFAVSKAWARWNQLPLFQAFERGVVPITVGLILASGCILTVAAAANTMSYVVTAGTAAFILFTRANPLIALGIAAGLGLLGLV
jgi:chromate transporter